jgi:hypothetical protein
MNAKSLRKIIRNLPEHGFYSIKLEASKRLAINTNPWYTSQREHWLGWLKEYDGPGAYGRKTHSGITAKSIYNRVQNSAMLLYLPEAMGVSKKLIKEAFETALKTDLTSMGKQCGVIRKIIPWDVVQEAIESKA